MAYDDDNDWLLCPRCGCGITEVDIRELGRCTNCWFGFDDENNLKLFCYTTLDKDYRRVYSALTMTQTNTTLD